jgi:hypothetical protein
MLMRDHKLFTEIGTAAMQSPVARSLHTRVVVISGSFVTPLWRTTGQRDQK